MFWEKKSFKFEKQWSETWEVRCRGRRGAGGEGAPCAEGCGTKEASGCRSRRREPAGSRFGGLGDKLGCRWDTQLAIETGVPPTVEDLEPLGVVSSRRASVWQGVERRAESGSTEIPQGCGAAPSTLLPVPWLWSGRGAGGEPA